MKNTNRILIVLIVFLVFSLPAHKSFSNDETPDQVKQQILNANTSIPKAQRQKMLDAYDSSLKSVPDEKRETMRLQMYKNLLKAVNAQFKKSTTKAASSSTQGNDNGGSSDDKIQQMMDRHKKQEAQSAVEKVKKDEAKEKALESTQAIANKQDEARRRREKSKQAKAEELKKLQNACKAGDGTACYQISASNGKPLDYSEENLLELVGSIKVWKVSETGNCQQLPYGFRDYYTDVLKASDHPEKCKFTQEHRATLFIYKADCGGKEAEYTSDSQEGCESLRPKKK